MNDDSKFRAIPKLDSFKIPFKLDEESLLDWLTSLNLSDGKSACMQTMALLQALNKTEISSKNRLSFLKLIDGYLKQYISRLPGQCWDSGFPLSAKEIAYAEIITWNYLLLAQGFFITAETAGKKSEIAYLLAMTLHELGRAQLHIAATYSCPNTGFWHFLYQVFYIAEQKGVQNLQVESDVFKLVTINTLFARSLIFHLCDTNQFQARDIRTIFNSLPQVCVDLPITIYPDNQQETFMLDLKYDNPPLNVKHQLELGSELVRYFSPLTVANNIQQILNQGNTWSGTLKSINNTLFSRVVKTLELKQKRKYTRKKEDYSLLGVIGFENIISFLHKMTKAPLVDANPLMDSNKTVSEDIDSDLDDDFGLSEVIILNKQTPQKPFSPPQEIWEPKKVSLEKPFKHVALREIKIYDTSANGYSVSWTPPPAKGRIGELIGIISPDKKRLEIAIIRRIILTSTDVIRKFSLKTGSDPASDSDSVSHFRMGTEVIGFESEIVYLASTKDKNKGAWAILIPGIEVLKRPDTVIYALGQFNTNDLVYLHRNNETKTVLLLKELHSTVAVSYVELAYAKN